MSVEKKQPPQKNLWATFGTGKFPNAWYNAISVARYVLILCNISLTQAKATIFLGGFYDR